MFNFIESVHKYVNAESSPNTAEKVPRLPTEAEILTNSLMQVIVVKKVNSIRQFIDIFATVCGSR